MARRLDASAPGFGAEFDILLGQKREATADVDRDVAAIIADVRTRGDAALLELTAKFDRLDVADLRMLRVSTDEIAAAVAVIRPDVLDALKFAAARIRSFHEKQFPADIDYTDDAGVGLGARWRPVPAVGLYVPGGTAAYPSSVLMNALPAKVAGVPRLAMVVPW